MPIIGSIFGSSEGKATMGAARKNQQLLSDLKTEGMGYLDRAGTSLNRSVDVYAPYAEAGADSLTMLRNALGLEGAEGNAAATDAFQVGPGYQFALDQGLQALERGASSQGRVQSGQTGMDFIKYAQGLGNQEYGNWLSRLEGMTQTGLAGASGQATGHRSLADLEKDRLDLAGTVAGGRAGANNQFAYGKETNRAATSFNDQDLLALGKVFGYGMGF